MTILVDGFAVKTTRAFKSSPLYQTLEDNAGDIFDPIDPLLSPIPYSLGIKPGAAPENPPTSESAFRDPLRLSLIPRDPVDPLHQKGAPMNPDFFDPTISPHAYRNGTPNTLGGDKRALEAQQQQQQLDTEMEEYSPFLLSKTLGEHQKQTASSSSSSATISPDVFDPLLSPHSYPNGTPNKLVVDQRKVGILLMDHGSRNKASNDRLHELANIYQQTVASHIIVKGAHMELASPSIPEGIEALLKEGVDEIVCHPYFLSANGRHVSEDIPEIIKGAIDALNVKIPIVTTDPVGSQTEIMIGAIQNMVKQHSSILKEQNR